MTQPILSIDSTISRNSKDKGTVKLIQEWLNFHNYDIGSIDGDYGAATELAVIKFQEVSDLPNTGSVDPETFNKLVEPMAYSLEFCENTCSNDEDALRELTLKYANKHANLPAREIGGDNKGPWVRMYLDGLEDKWCAGFVNFCIGQATKELGLDRPVKKTFSCDEVAASGKQEGLFISENDSNKFDKIKPGSIFLIRKSATDWTHVGFVWKVNKDNNRFISIEGNGDPKVISRVHSFTNMDFITF